MQKKEEEKRISKITFTAMINVVRVFVNVEFYVCFNGYCFAFWPQSRACQVDGYTHANWNWCENRLVCSNVPVCVQTTWSTNNNNSNNKKKVNMDIYTFIGRCGRFVGAIWQWQNHQFSFLIVFSAHIYMILIIIRRCTHKFGSRLVK